MMNAKIIFSLFVVTILSYANAQKCITFHKVRLGDTCFAIAAKYNLEFNEINILNPNLNCDSLREGQKLCVEQEIMQREKCKNVHVVKQSETCNYIANMVGTSFDDLKRCNSIINLDCTNLFIGQKLLF